MNLAKVPSRVSENRAEASEDSSNSSTRIEDAIERVLEGKLAKRDIPEVTRRITQIAVSEQFSGPMPHPKHLREYEEVLPGSAERILSMAERSLEANVELHSAGVKAEISDRKLGMWLGAALFALLIIGAFSALFVTSNAVVPGLFLGTAAVGGVVAFIRGRNGK